MDKEQVIKQIKSIVPLLSKCISLNYLVLFGSYANGTPNENSDIDIAVVSNNLPKGLVNREILEALVDASKINDKFEPHFFRLEKWENPEEGSFVEGVKRTGTVIYKNGL